MGQHPVVVAAKQHVADNHLGSRDRRDRDHIAVVDRRVHTAALGAKPDEGTGRQGIVDDRAEKARISHKNAARETIYSVDVISLMAAPVTSLRELAATFLSPDALPAWPPGTDVDAFLATVATEGIAGLLHERIRATPAHHLPPTLVAGLRDAAHRQVARELAQRIELQSIVAALSDRGVATLLMKGASLAYDVYVEPAWRTRSDVDMLIRSRDRANVEACLIGLGYECEPQVSGRFATHQFHAMRIDAHGVRHLCDVHWRISNPQRFADAIAFDELWQSAIPLKTIGPGARGLGRAHALWLACVHRVAHHQDRDAIPWLYDIHLLLERMDEEDLARFLALAERTGVRRICLHALLLARARIGTTIPPAALIALEAAGVDEPSTVFLRPGLRQLDILLDDLRVLPGWRARLTLLKEHVFPNAAYLRRTYAQGSSAPLLWLYCRRVVVGASKWFAPNAGG